MARKKSPVTTMDRKNAQILLRKRLDAAGRRYQTTIAGINEELEKQRRICREEYEQIRERLDDAVRAEAEAEAAAKVDRTKAEERRRAAHARKVAATAEKRAELAQKKRLCSVESDALREQKRAEKSYHAEAVAIERSMLKRGDASRAWDRQTKSEEREQVERDIPDEYRPLWKRVGRTFTVPKKKEGWTSLSEAFLEFAAENPDAVAEAQEAELEAGMREAQKRENKLRRGSGARGAKRARREDLPPAPF